MGDVDGDFLKKWRERYRWPFCMSRIASEERILYLENLVINNVLKSGSWSVKDVFLEIVNWKTGGAQVPRFCGNDDKTLLSAVSSVVHRLREDADDVSQCIEILRSLRGVAIPVASAFLRFLDPIEHRYGIIDKNTAMFLNTKRITDFHLDEHGYLVPSSENANEYQKYHKWLRQKADEINQGNLTYADIYGIERNFTAVDIDMALFAFSFVNKRRLRERLYGKERSEQISVWLKQYEKDMMRAFDEYISGMFEESFEEEEENSYDLGGIFECPYCEKAFFSEEELQEHELSHT